ncbi:hypothetical protein [Streptomyces sp. NPDC051572]|uniref:hypothetical protein n=1 Tax=Streptomyces sp. NPDC051572 TaxID=3155802 RepID=UPI00344E543D
MTLRTRNEVCPDCNGNGNVVPEWFGPYDEPITCKPCGGDGWIVVEYDDEEEE